MTTDTATDTISVRDALHLIADHAPDDNLPNKVQVFYWCNTSDEFRVWIRALRRIGTVERHDDESHTSAVVALTHVTVIVYCYTRHLRCEEVTVPDERVERRAIWPEGNQ